MKVANRSQPGRVRIIGGSLRNSRLDVPQLTGLRPTPERVRETLFNWLEPMISGARCLDLCAGTGALGIEALSRGAGRVQFVERDVQAAQALRDNLARLKIAGMVANLEAAAFLGANARPHDLVFIDPPFALLLWDGLAAQLEQGGWLTPDAWIYVESAREALLSLPACWHLHRHGETGEVRFALYRRALPLS